MLKIGILVSLFCGLLVGCGHTGPLYLPVASDHAADKGNNAK